MNNQTLISVIEDSHETRIALASIVKSENREVASYNSAEEALEHFDPARPGCLIVDYQLDGMSGIDLLQVVNGKGHGQPVILVSAFADVPTTVEAMRAGAMTVLEKPCDAELLNAAVDQALKLDVQRRSAYEKYQETLEKYRTLTTRELPVLEKLLAGAPNKRIASDLDIGLRTVELRRATIMKKMGASSLAELVRVVLTVWTTVDPEDPPDQAALANRPVAQTV